MEVTVVDGTNQKKGNVRIQIAPETEIEVKKVDLRLGNDQTLDLSELYQTKENQQIIIKPTKLTEIIELKEIEKLKQLKRAKNIREPLAFLGTINYFRRL